MQKTSCLIAVFLLLIIHCKAQKGKEVYTVLFGKNKYHLSLSSSSLLSAIGDSLLSKKGYKIFINGHTDNDADTSYNQQLSLKRSLAVRSFLIAKGIDSTLIVTNAMGEEQPLVANTTPLAKAKNRRVELLVLFEIPPAVETAKTEKWRTKIDTITKPNDCSGDTLVELDNGYKVMLTKCDWQNNSQCLQIEKKLLYNKFTIKENWLKKHIGFGNYKKYISYEPYYKFKIVSCANNCFTKPIKIFIPQYQVKGLDITLKFSQKQNNQGRVTSLSFKKGKELEAAYYETEIYCPGNFRCGTDNRCNHLIKLIAKNCIKILNYSYYERGSSSYFDSLIMATPTNPSKLEDEYKHAFFETLTLLYNGDTIKLKNLPIDIMAHNQRKIHPPEYGYEKKYFLFIPYRKKYWCGHYKKYKIRPKDLDKLREFNIDQLQIENN